MSAPDTEHDSQSIAVIGLACRFPGASTPEQFWANLLDGVESVRATPDGGDGWVNARSTLDGIDEFDAEFFGYSPREAALLDPQHRLFLEVCWQALEDGGAAGRRRTSGIGVYGGSGTSLYLMHHLSGHAGKDRPNYLDSAHDLQLAMAAERDYLTSRVGYKLDLDGPSVNVQAACATSLYALHLAGQALLAGECDLALAGGAHVPVPQIAGYRPEPGLVLSQDGHCRAFSADATGTVFGSGVGAVLLKPLDRALADNDRVYAVVRGTAINNDGASKPGFSTPSVVGQAAVIRQALAAADVDPATIGYVEAHGTATPTGDPIEVAALTEAFAGVAPQSCALGSVKTNIGHLSWAGGIAGVIKTVLALWHAKLPASLHFREPNPAIDFASSPFYVQSATTDWPAGPGPRRAGVSAFGLGGANAHVVLQEAPPSSAVVAPSGPVVLPVSGRDERALREAATRVADAMAVDGAPEMVDAAYSLGVGRRHFAHRVAVVAADPTTAAALLESVGDGNVEAADRFDGEIGLSVGTAPNTAPRLVTMFSGQGGEYLEAGRDLYAHEPVFRDFVDAADAEFEERTGQRLTELLYRDAARRGEPLADIRLAQPAVYTVQVALARLWESWGLAPSTLLGHSLGEYAAAHCAGVFDFGTGLYLVSERARLLRTLPEDGAMAAVHVGLDRVRELLGDRIDVGVAAINAPDRTVISGARDGLEQVLARAERDGVRFRRLRIGRAGHSAQIDAVLDEFTAVVESVELRTPTRSLVSTLTGAAADARITTADYWRRQLREPVRFLAALETASGDPDSAVFLEIGMSNTLTSLVPPALDDGSGRVPVCLEPLRWERDDRASTRLALAGAYTAGLEVDWAAVASGGRTVSMPTYPFQRRSHWVEPVRTAAAADRVDSDSMGARAVAPPAVEATHYAVSWIDAPSSAADARTVGRCLVLAPSEHAAKALTYELERLGVQVRVHVLAEEGEDADDTVADVARVLGEHRPELILNAVPALRARHRDLAGLPHTTDSVADDVAAAGGRATLAALRAASAANLPGIVFCTVTSGAQRVLVADEARPAQAAVIGIARTARTEFTTMRHLLVDLAAVETRRGEESTWARLAVVVATVPDRDAEVALRGERALIPRLRPVAPPEGGPRVAIAADGWYLVIGGLSGVGLECALALLESGARRLVLAGRRTPDAETGARLARLEREYAAVIRTERVDVTRSAQVEAVFARYRAEGSPVRGVVHAAGVVDDAILDRTDWARMTRVLAPKAQGAWNLHRAAAEHAPDLDLFVLTSSYGGLFGNPGQAGHAAANTFLDALAGHRRGLGLAGLALDLGSWSDVGYLAGEEEFLRGLERQGIGTISASAGRPAVRAAMTGWRSGQVAVLPGRWDRLDPEHHLASNPVLAEMVGGDRTTPGGDEQPTVAGVEDIPGACRRVLSAVLGYPDEELDGLDLTRAGMDSLNALTIRNKLQRSLSVPLPASICFDRPTLAELCADIEKRMAEVDRD